MAPAKRYRVQPPLSAGESLEVGAPSPLAERAFIGRPAEIGPTRRFYFDTGQEHVLAIVGKRGSGKSYTLGILAEALAAREAESTIGTTRRRHAAILLDTLNIYCYTEIPLVSDSQLPLIAAQAAPMRAWGLDPEPLDVAVWVPAGRRWPGMPGHYRDLFISASDLDGFDWAALLGLDATKDPQGQLLLDAYDAAAASSRSFEPEDLVEALSLPALAEVYHEETIRALRRQLRSIVRDRLFSGSGTPLTELAVAGQVAVLMLNQLPEDLRAVVAAVLFRKLLHARSASAFAQKQLAFNAQLSIEERTAAESAVANAIPPLWVMIDEAQNVIPSERKTRATDDLVRLVREGRNSGISAVVTTQQPSAIDSRIMAQVDTLFVHQLVTQPDIDVVRRNIKSRDPTDVRHGDERLDFSDVIRSLSVGQCIVSSTDAPRWFICSTRPRVSAHGGVGSATASA